MAYAVEVRELQAQPSLAVRVTVPVAAIPETMGPIFGEIYSCVGRKGAQPAGPPYTRYHSFDPEAVDMEVGAPIYAATEGEGRVVASELPAGPVACTWHIGPYDRLSEAYDSLMAWVQENGRKVAGGMWEVYHTDPQQEPDPGKWRTEVFVPLV